MKFDVTQIIAPEFHAPLVRVARNEMIKFTPAPANCPHSIAFQFCGDWDTDPMLRHFKTLAYSQKSGDEFQFPDVVAFEGVGKLLADGCKMFQPTIEQCRAAENISIDIPFAMYRQPYEAMLINLPEQLTAELSIKYDCKAPRNVVLRYHEDLCISICAFDQSMGFCMCVICKNGCSESIESGLARNNKIPTNYLIATQHAERIALNLALLLTHFDITTRPLDPKQDVKLSALCRRQDPDERARGERLKLRRVDVIEFSQDVKFWDEVTEHATAYGGGASDYTGEVIAPHWRRGHFRREMGYRRIIEAGGQPRRIFIRPVLVNKHRFVGDLQNTEAVYRG